MNKHLVFTVKSLQVILKSASSKWFEAMAADLNNTTNIHKVEGANTLCYFHREDASPTRKIIIVNQHEIWPTNADASRDLLERILSVAIRNERPPFHLPRDWAEFHHANRMAFFACRRKFGKLRWIIEMGPDNSRHVCFWKLTTADNHQLLEEYNPNGETYRTIDRESDENLRISRTWFVDNPIDAKVKSLQDVVDLDEMSFGSVTQFRTYSDWLPLLTVQQNAFLKWPVDAPVKLKGVAGSGKTLVMILKALRELYASSENGRTLRILYVTHSWEVADKVISSFRLMDERDLYSQIDVLPLLYIAQSNLPKERSALGFRLLGEDSLEGKLLQLREINSILEKVKVSDWIVFKDRVSPGLKQRVEAELGTLERNALVWDLMYEFACVLSAHGIIPGINAERKYLELSRAKWMMPLLNVFDMRFVLKVYTEFVRVIKVQRLLTSDQLINDYINYLETFTWNMLREAEGYDVIFVDELHLFNDQERLAMTYLSKNPDVYPVILMALDPRQSPAEVFAEFPVADVKGRESGVPERLLGKVERLELSTVHRFSPEILSLVKHIHNAYPTLDLGLDWEVDVASLTASGEPGKVPALRCYNSQDEEFRLTLARAEEWERKTKQRTAVVVVDTTLLPRIVEMATSSDEKRFTIINSRDDLESTIRYAKRNVIVSAAEFVAGLQFDHVFICGISNVSKGVANLGYQKRRFLSLLYLAVSRAARSVEISTNHADGGVPEILESAVSANVIRSEAAC